MLQIKLCIAFLTNNNIKTLDKPQKTPNLNLFKTQWGIVKKSKNQLICPKHRIRMLSWDTCLISYCIQNVSLTIFEICQYE